MYSPRVDRASPTIHTHKQYKPSSMALVVRGAQAARAFAQSPQGKALIAQAVLSGIQGARNRSTSTPVTRAQRPRQPPPRRQPRRPTLGPQFGAMGVCAITNPFCDESKGSRWPDDSSAHSVAIPVRYRAPIYVGASGNAAFLFTAQAIRPQALGTVVGNSVTGWTPNGIGAAAIFYKSSGVRVVSGGIKFVSTLAPMTASGSVTFIELPPNSDSDPDTGSTPFADYVGLDLTNQNRATYLTTALRNDNAIYSLFRPQGSEARSFNSLVDMIDDVGVAKTYDTFDWTSQVVYIQGAPPSSTVGFVDYFLNVEVSFDVLSELSLFARPAPASNPSLIQASQALLRSPNVHVGDDSSVDNEFMSRAMGYLKRGALSIANHGLLALENAASNYLSGGQYSAGATTISRGMSIRQISDHP